MAYATSLHFPRRPVIFGLRLYVFQYGDNVPYNIYDMSVLQASYVIKITSKGRQLIQTSP